MPVHKVMVQPDEVEVITALSYALITCKKQRREIDIVVFNKKETIGQCWARVS